MTKEELCRHLWRYGKMLKDMEYENEGHDNRVIIYSFEDKLWYVHMSEGDVIECHELKP